jgi:hypothetical protein
VACFSAIMTRSFQSQHDCQDFASSLEKDDKRLALDHDNLQDVPTFFIYEIILNYNRFTASVPSVYRFEIN